MVSIYIFITSCPGARGVLARLQNNNRKNTRQWVLLNGHLIMTY